MSNGRTVHQFNTPIDIGWGALITAASRRGDNITVQVVGSTERNGQVDLAVAFDAHRGFTPAKLREVREAVGSNHGKR